MAGQRVWIPPDQHVEVQGRRLPGGLYVGESLTALTGWSAEPALIAPDLPARDRRPDHLGTTMGYWPSYSEISTPARTAYLDWLASGRPGGAYIGYVFLFFYGIERRVLVDAVHLPEARSEVPALLGEVERLLALFGDNRSFSGYARNFLSAARLLHGQGDSAAVEPPMEPTGWDFPVELKMTLGRLVAANQPIPADWALSWLRCHPAVFLRTPAQRCADEFNTLFVIRYQDRFGEGMRVRGQRKLRLSYHAASAGFGGEVTLNAADLVDVTGLEKPISDLRALGKAVCAELDAFSRWVGRRDDRTSLAATALLPRELSSSTDSAELRQLISALTDAIGPDGLGVVPARVLTTAWPQRTPGKLSRSEATQLLTALERQGFGIEPDVRLGGSNLGAQEHAVVFRVPGPLTHGPQLQSAAAMLRLAAVVALADGQGSSDEELAMVSRLERVLPLDEAERLRLRALARWLLTEQETAISGLKQQFAEVDEARRTSIARFLVTIVAADGTVAPKEVSALIRIYRLLGLDQAQVHSDLHAAGSDSEAPLPTVLPAESASNFTIPQQPTEALVVSAGVVLDPEKVKRVAASTAEVAAILHEVFAADDEPGPDEREEDVEDEMSPIPGLDAVHARLVEYLVTRPMWPRGEFEELTGRLQLMPNGAIDVVNTLAYERSGGPLLFGDDPLEVDAEVAEELTHGR